MAALSDVVLDDEAAGKVPSLIEVETAQPEHKTQWLDTGPPGSDKQLESADTYIPPETEAPGPHNLHGNKTQWLDTEASRPLSNKVQWQGGIRSDSNETRPRWSDSGIYKPPHKLQWQNAAKREIETWLTSNPGEPGNKPQQRVAGTDKTKDWDEVDVTTAQQKKPYNKQATKSTENFTSEPILMKLPKVIFS